MTAASRRQVGMLHGILARLSITERDEKLRIVGASIWRTITTTNDLTRDEASVAISTLQGIAERDDRASALAALVAQAVPS